jgi:hypothetical protein
MIICFYKQQLEVLMQQRWIQCDMAYKRLKNKNEKEIVFAMMNKTNRKSKNIFEMYSESITNKLAFTLLRILVNQETTEMYYQMFKRVFTLIETRFGYPVRWQHLHQEGFGALVMDMDTKQLPGSLNINIF